MYIYIYIYTCAVILIKQVLWVCEAIDASVQQEMVSDPSDERVDLNDDTPLRPAFGLGERKGSCSAPLCGQEDEQGKHTGLRTPPLLQDWSGFPLSLPAA